ncbi:MAG: hypothetical protein JXJ22_15160 [Bacteroidales bacterium]|nr:hypothetical protein [Bacteroidales bacterium]
MMTNKIIPYLICTLYLFSNCEFPGYSSDMPSGRISDPVSVGENIRIVTDRTLYAVTENIYFKAYYFSNEDLKNDLWSRVLYVELISQECEVIVQSKFPLNQQGTNGIINIPENLLTGNYFLRAYTKWMLNFEPEVYAYNSLKIINPFKDHIKVDVPGDNDVPFIESYPVKTENYIICESNKTVYHKREKVSLKIALPENLRLNPDFCLAVFRKGSIDTLTYGASFNKPLLDIVSEKLDYPPELRGITVSGKIVNSTNNEPVKSSLVQMALLGNRPDYSGYISNEEGRFIFVLPERHGPQDLFLTAQHVENDVQLMVDNEFNVKPAGLPLVPFDLTPQELQIAEEMLINMQVEHVFNKNLYATSVDTMKSEDVIPFYGNPIETIIIDNYIDLPNLEEVINELVPDVKIIKSKNRSYIKVYSRSELSFFPLLIMVDYIPVSDQQAILNLSPKKIDRIEVINRVYIKGSMRYGGLISIISKKGDFAGIDLPSNSSFYNIDTYSIIEKICFPVYNTSVVDNTPDFRNCLYWEPNIQLDQAKQANLEFYTSDQKGTYTILVRGFSENGNKRIIGKCEFNVE